MTPLREATNQRLPDDFDADKNDHVVSGGWTDDNPRELLDDSIYAATPDAIVDRHRTA